MSVARKTAARSGGESSGLSGQESPDGPGGAGVVRFSFDHGGVTHTFPVPLFEAITVGFVRRNRRRNDADFTFTALEALAGDSVEGQRVLAVVDGMSRPDFAAVARKFNDELGSLS